MEIPLPRHHNNINGAHGTCALASPCWRFARKCGSFGVGLWPRVQVYGMRQDQACSQTLRCAGALLPKAQGSACAVGVVHSRSGSTTAKCITESVHRVSIESNFCSNSVVGCEVRIISRHCPRARHQRTIMSYRNARRAQAGLIYLLVGLRSMELAGAAGLVGYFWEDNSTAAEYSCDRNSISNAQHPLRCQLSPPFLCQQTVVFAVVWCHFATRPCRTEKIPLIEVTNETGRKEFYYRALLYHPPTTYENNEFSRTSLSRRLFEL